MNDDAHLTHLCLVDSFILEVRTNPFSISGDTLQNWASGQILQTVRSDADTWDI